MSCSPALLIHISLALVPRPLTIRWQPAASRCMHSPTCGVSERMLWEPQVHARLTLVRHGQSEWNLANRFTGWVDVDLTERGITEARAAGRLLAADGQQHDLVVTSMLRRAIRTSCLVLSGTDQCWLPMTKDPRLNEQCVGPTNRVLRANACVRNASFDHHITL